MLVVSAARVWSLVWPEDVQCRHLKCYLRGFWALVSSTVRLWFLVWPMELWCKCVVWFRGFAGTCGSHSVGFVPSYSLRTCGVITWWGLGGLWVLVGSMVMGLSLV